MPCGFIAMCAWTTGSVCDRQPERLGRARLYARQCFSPATVGWWRAPAQEGLLRVVRSAAEHVRVMKAFVIIVAASSAVIVGLLFTLRSSRNVGMPSRC